MKAVTHEYPIPADVVTARRVSENTLVDDKGAEYKMDGGPCLFYDSVGNKYGLSEWDSVCILIPIKPHQKELEDLFRNGANWW